MTNRKNMRLTKRHRVWGMGVEDFAALWAWGLFWGFPQVFWWVWDQYGD